MASKSSIEAGRGHVTLWSDDGPLMKGLAAAQAKVQAWGKGIAEIGAGVAASGAAVTAPFLAGLQLTYLTQGLHTTTEQLQPAIAKMSTFLHEAANGSVEANAALRTLGLTIGELNGLSQGDRLQRIAESLGNVADQGERIRLQRAILGRNAQAFNVEGGREGMRERAARRQRVEGAPTEGDQQMAAATSRAFHEMSAAITSIWREVGAAAAPVMREFYNIVLEVAIAVRQFITTHRDTLTIVFRVADAMVTAGTIIGILGGVIYGASYAFAFLSGAVAIVGTALGVLWGWATFAASGFGVLTLWTWATTAAAMAYNVVAAIMNIAWAAGAGFLGIYSAATVAGMVSTHGSTLALIAYNAVVWLVNAANAAAAVVMGLFTASTVAAQAGTHGFSLALIFAWIWENIASAGIYLLITALGVLVVALLAIGGVGIVLVLAGIVYGIGSLIASTETAQAAWAGFTGAIGSAAGNAWASCTRAFAGILDTVKTTFGGIMDAIQSGNWSLAWEIMKTGAILAWQQISLFVGEQWVTWKTAAVAVWHTIADALEDAFHGVMTSIHVMFLSLGGQIASIVQTALALAMETAERAFRAIGMTGRADTARDAARAARTAATAATSGTAETAVTDAAARAQRQRDADRRERDRVAAELAAAELAGLDDGEIARLQSRLRMLRDNAWYEAGTAYDPWAADEGPATSEGFAGNGRNQMTGTFFADALAGWFGGSGQTVADRQLTQARMQTDLLRRLADRLDVMDGAEFG
jgi:hypothetical protein